MCFNLLERFLLKTGHGKPLQFLRPGGGILKVGPAALRQIASERQTSVSACESGGVILGRIINESPDFVVDMVTKPTKADRRSRYAFHRAERPTQSRIIKAWTASQGERNYLGEWHTHPEDDPTPSYIDKRDWRRLAKEAKFEQEALFFVIAGRKRMRVWEVSRGGSTIRQLKEIDSER
jgi:integrative and conjugative element protein (TIGR02256 family)